MSILDDLDLSRIVDERVRQCLVFLVNLVDAQKHEISELRAENQRLRDEINRLKGEQGKPTIKGNKLPSGKGYQVLIRAGTTKATKIPTVRVDREQVLRIDPAMLPADAEFKGYEDVIVQDLIFRADNVRFRKEKFHSPAEHKTYLAPLPPGYVGQFGPGIKALSLVLAFGADVSEPKIHELFGEVGVQISVGEVSNLLIHGQERFHAEKDAVVEAGLRSSPWQHLDQTGTRVNGQNQNCQQVARLPHDQIWDEATREALLDQHLPRVGPQQRRWIADATAVAAYHAQDAYPIVRLLLCDDAPQFGGITDALALCWIHEGRHDKKLTPWVKALQDTLAAFLTRFWDYYR